MNNKNLITNQQMKESWEDKAVTNAYHWVDSSKQTWDSREEYYIKGENEVKEHFFNELQKKGFEDKDFKSKEVLDIGCGTGRLCRALSRKFKLVWGIDISDEMISKAKRDNQQIDNINFSVNTGSDLKEFSDGSIDFIFSFIVFQHIPEKKVVVKYLTEMYRVIDKRGACRFQVRGYPGLLNTNTPSFLYKGFNKSYIAVELKRGFIPVPVFKRYNTVHGVFFKPKELKKILKEIGFKKIDIDLDSNNLKYLWATVVK